MKLNTVIVVKHFSVGYFSSTMFKILDTKVTSDLAPLFLKCAWHRIHKWRTRGKKLVLSHESEALKNLFMLSVRISSYGCTREAWRARSPRTTLASWVSLVNEPREWIFHPLLSSTWPVLCNGRRLLRQQVGHISVAYFFFSYHQDLFIFLFYRIEVRWLSYSVSMWSRFGLTCLPLLCSYRPLVELLMLRKPTKWSCFLEDIRVPFDCKQKTSTKH